MQQYSPFYSAIHFSILETQKFEIQKKIFYDKIFLQLYYYSTAKRDSLLLITQNL